MIRLHIRLVKYLPRGSCYQQIIGCKALNILSFQFIQVLDKWWYRSMKMILGKRLNYRQFSIVRVLILPFKIIMSQHKWTGVLFHKAQLLGVSFLQLRNNHCKS